MNRRRDAERLATTDTLLEGDATGTRRTPYSLSTSIEHFPDGIGSVFSFF